MSMMLRGRIGRGMFLNEVAFIVTDHGGAEHIVLIPAEMVQETQGAPSIPVRLVDQEGDIALVRVPGEPLDSSTVSVKTTQLVSV